MVYYKNNREAIKAAKRGMDAPWGSDEDIVSTLNGIYSQYTMEQCREILEIAKKEVAKEKEKKRK